MATAIMGTPLLTSPTADMSAAGTYPIVVNMTGVATTSNYMFDFPATVPGTLTVTASDNPEAVLVNGVSLSAYTAEIETGATFPLEAYVSPADATNKGVTWSSSNLGTATVSDNGEVTGISAGGAIITATTDDGGYTASCIVMVLSNTVKVEQTSRPVEVVFEQSHLRVTSPEAEVIAVYSFTGQLLLSDKKPQGSILLMPGNLSGEKAVIVTGSSGWAVKLMVNY
jgi:hypothetical protein